MKYRIAITLAYVVDFIDDKIFDHASRFTPLWLVIGYPLCAWSFNIFDWAGKICCDEGCRRCCTPEFLAHLYGGMDTGEFDNV